MNPWSRVVATVGLTRAKVAAVAVVALFATAGLASLGAQLLGASTGAGVTDYPTLARRAGDADLDGLPDVLENRLGSSPDHRDTLGHGVPDGWVYQWYRGAADWNDTAALDQPALVPPANTLPEALREPGALRLPTVAELYKLEAAGRGEGTWWLDAPAVDPLDWDNDHDGIADAWLVAHGLRPWEAKADQPAPGDPSYTLREKYEQGLDPATADTDGDGLSDRAEASGRATFGDHAVTFQRTDPLRASTRGDGLPDGFVVRFGLDPHDDAVGDHAPLPGGLTVREAFIETERLCRADGKPCDWATRLAKGPLVDPTDWDANDDGVPDAWVVRESHGQLAPLDDARKLVLSDTTEWDATKWAGERSAPSLVVDAANPAPKAPFKATLADYYARSRPVGWNETELGPWWGGIPSDLTSPEGALPPAVALRGWNITVDPCRGCRDDAARAEQLLTLSASADPRLADTDGDGLPDVVEYLGWTKEGPGARTNPFDTDTDGDGLSDCQEAFFSDPSHCHLDDGGAPDGGLGTSPLRRDSAGSFLTDGEAYAYWSARYAKAVQDFNQDRAKAAITYRFLTSGTLTAAALEKLRPDGSLDGATSNLLSADADGDGFPNGAELLPNLYFQPRVSQERPATDPARADSDGDGLPDRWELSWAVNERYYVDCPTRFCRGPLPDFQGWPLNPARYDSFDPTATEVSHDAVSDASRNLKGDQVRVSTTLVRQFRNDLAYRYGLDPFKADSSPQDRIPDMFAIQWGVEAVPDAVRDLADGDDRFAWVAEAGRQLEGARPPDAGTTPITHAVIDPRRFIDRNETGTPSHPGIDIDRSANLRGYFLGHPKGTWVFQGGDCADPQPIPGTDPRAFTTSPVPRGCWAWVDYPLGSDIDNRTNPWEDDFDGDGLPDAWVFHYGLADAKGGAPLPSSVFQGCNDSRKMGSLPTPADPNAYCLTYLDAYENGLDPTFPKDTDGDGIPNDPVTGKDDPLVGDTDRGGLADWYEIALRDGPSHANLDPLNRLDDHGEEDWDGDGLLNEVEQQLGTNLLSPDYDHDGLLDGDPVGVKPTPFASAATGDGDLCLRPGDDPIGDWRSEHGGSWGPGMGGMAHRPAFLGAEVLGADDHDGPLTHDQLIAWYRSLGILTKPGASHCPAGAPYVLVLREALRDSNGRLRGSGGGSDSLKSDTSGGGVPDGWLVHWRDSAGSNAAVAGLLDPTKAASAAGDADGDHVSTLLEYRWGRPAAWNESRDGPWWGGLNPADPDSDGDKRWFRAFQAGDDVDPDGDADGLPLGVDPFPDADHANAGIIRATAAGYATNFTLLWDALDGRAQASLLDGDGDGVPDALDRARVQITMLTPTQGGQALATLGKGDDTPFTVRGHVQTLEPNRGGSNYVHDGDGSALTNAAGSGAAVAGATVTVLLCSLDTKGQCDPATGIAVLGAGLTNANGDYTISASLRAQVTPALSGGATARGHPSGAAFPSGVDALRPGPARLWAMVEPNDSARQALSFGGKPAAHAYKDVGVNDDGATAVPGTLPGQGFTLRAARLGADGQPDQDTAFVEHAAAAIFGGHATPLNLPLQGKAKLVDVAATPAQPRRGDNFTVAGRLVDAAGVALAGRTILVQVGNAPEGSAFAPLRKTDAKGAFSVTFLTGGLAPGPLTVHVDGRLDTSGPDAFLTPPSKVDLAVAVSQKTLWGDPPVRIAGHGVPERGDVTLPDPEQGVTVEATLREFPSGEVVPNRPVHATVRSSAGSTVLLSRDGTTDGNGRLTLTLPALPSGTPAESLQLRLVAEGLTGGDEPATSTYFLRPLFPTRLTVEEGIGSLGEKVQLRGHLERLVGGVASPVTGVQGSIRASFNGEVLWANATDEHGNFTIGVRSQVPAANAWSFQFFPAPGKLLQPSPLVSARALHTARTALSVLDAAGVAGEPVAVTGRLAWVPAEAGVYGQTVRVGWLDDGADDGFAAGSVEVPTTANGLFHAVLPAQPHTGTARAVMAFEGSPAFGPARLEADVPILSPTRITLALPDVLVEADGATPGVLGLRLENGTQRLPGRELHVSLTGPGGANRTLDRLTGGTGEAEVRLQDLKLDHAGAWTVRAAYAGSGNERPTTATGVLTVTLRAQLVVDRIPAAVYPGDRVLLQGHLVAPNHAPDPVAFQASLDGEPVGGAAALEGAPWSLALQVPADAATGEHVLAITGAAPGVAVEPVEVVLAVRAAVQAVLDVTEATDGSRTVSLHFVDGSGQPVQRGLHLVLIRQGDDGRVLGIHELDTAADGTGSLGLSADEGGKVTVLQINDRLLALDSLAINTSALEPVPRSGLPAWLLWGGVALGAALAGAAAWSYRRWRRSADLGLEALLLQARQSLADPTLPAAEVIRRAYASLLEVLQKAGYTPKDADTVRTITATVESAFGLPQAPWRTVSGLFETAAYSRVVLSPADRHAAQQAFGTLAQWWSRRVQGARA